MNDAGQGQAGSGLPPGISFEEAQGIVQGNPATLAALAARFGANPILPLQPDFIDFFVELPSDSWLALRQMMVVAKVRIRDIDKKVAARRMELARAAGRDPHREICFSIAVALKAQGATFAAVREALLRARGPRSSRIGRATAARTRFAASTTAPAPRNCCR